MNRRARTHSLAVPVRRWILASLALSALALAAAAHAAEHASPGTPADALRGGWCGVARYGKQTARVSLHVAEEGAPALSADGLTLVFNSDCPS